MYGLLKDLFIKEKWFLFTASRCTFQSKHAAVDNNNNNNNKHVVIRLNCFYQIQGLIVDSIFFAVRVLRIWNSLPEDIVSAAHLSLCISRLVRIYSGLTNHNWCLPSVL